MPAPLRLFARPLVLLALLAAAVTPARAADDWAPNVTFTGTWHENATHAVEHDDQLDSLQLEADLLSWRDYALGRHDTLRLTAHLAAEAWPRYRRLLSGAGGGRLEWRHTFGAQPLAPTFSLEAGADALFASETGRDGTIFTFSAAFRKRVTDRIRILVQHEFEQHAADRAVYDRTTSESTLELGYDVSKLSRLTLAARYGNSDVLSYSTNPSANLVSVTRVSEPVTSFNRPHVLSSFDARTWAGRIAYLRAFDDASAVVVAYEVRNARAQPVRISNQLISVALVHQY